MQGTRHPLGPRHVPPAAVRTALPRLLVLLVVTAVALMPAAHATKVAPPAPEGLDPADALDHLARLPLATRTAFAPYLVEAAAANHLDPTTWPADAPAASLLANMTQTATCQQILRPLHARMLAGPAASDARLLQRARDCFSDGHYGDAALLNDDAWALIALANDPASADARAAVAQQLAARQHADGGWAWRDGGAPDVDTTGMVATALARSPPPQAWDQARAVAWLRGAGSPTAAGGFGSEPGEDANCDSTVWGVRGLRELGQPVPETAWRYLASLHNADGGYAYQAGGASNPLCTAEVATLLGIAMWDGWLPRPEAASTTAKAAAALPATALVAVLVGVAVAVASPASRRGH